MENYNNNIGGWLQVFQIVTFIGIVALPVTVLYEITIGIGLLHELDIFDIYLGVLILVIVLLPGMIFSIFIFLKISLNAQTTPKKINNLLAYMTLTSIVITVVFFCLFSWSGTYITPSFLNTIISDFLYYFIWTRYFNRSKRVRVFYGSNA